MFDPRDVPCLPCQHGYNGPHECDSPDYCPCDRWRSHPKEAETCAWAYYPSTRFVPGEYCDSPAVEGEPYCAEHGRMEES